MLERAQHFEIFSRRDGRWTLEATRVRLDESVALATELLARGPYEAVRIVRARSVEGRTLVETVVYQAERTDEREPPIRLAAADDRDCVCETFEDFLGPRSIARASHRPNCCISPAMPGAWRIPARCCRPRSSAPRASPPSREAGRRPRGGVSSRARSRRRCAAP